MDRPTNRSASVFAYEGIPPAGQLIPLGLQHVVAAVVGVITPSLIISGSEVCNLSADEKTTLIQASLVITALATLLQLFPAFRRIGSRLPVVMGISFAYVPALTAIGGQSGLPTILGAELAGGLIAVIFGIFVKPIRKLFPPLVTGTVIFTIGLSLYPTAVRYMAGGDASSEWFGGARSWGVALFTFAVVIFLNNFAKGIWKLGSLLFGMIAGYIAACFAGIVDLSGVADAQWASLPRFMPFEIEFVPSAVVSLAIVYIVNSVQTIGDLSSTTMGGMGRVPTDQELSGGIIGQGLMSIIGVFFGGLPVASFSQNVGIVTVNKVINRAVFAFSALVLLIAGLVPKFAAVLTTIPPVCDRRRHPVRLRHHHHDGHPDDRLRRRVHRAEEHGGRPVRRSGHGHHPGPRMSLRRGLPRLGIHRVRLHRGCGGGDHGHHPQPGPAKGPPRGVLDHVRAFPR